MATQLKRVRLPWAELEWLKLRPTWPRIRIGFCHLCRFKDRCPHPVQAAQGPCVRARCAPLVVRAQSHSLRRERKHKGQRRATGVAPLRLDRDRAAGGVSKRLARNRLARTVRAFKITDQHLDRAFTAPYCQQLVAITSNTTF